MVASNPANAGLLGPVALKHGSSVAECPVGRYAETRGEQVQALFYDVVIIFAECISRELQFSFRQTHCRGIVERNTYYALYSWHERVRVKALVSVACHIFHSGLSPFGKPTAKSLGVAIVYRCGFCYAASEKAEG